MRNLCVAALTGLLAATVSIAEVAPRIILDTDFGGDADDLGALAMLHNMMRNGECELLAVMNWNTERYASPAIVGLNNFYGHPQVRVATREGDIWHGEWQYGRAIAELLDADMSASDIPGTTHLYRELLSSAANASITIVTVGPLANIRDLLASAPDANSMLTGADLIKLKVARFVIMGGQFPSGDHEWNFDGDMPGVTREVLAGIDVPIVFAGYELGEVVRTGPALVALEPEHPLHAGYRHFSEHAPWMKARFAGEILDNASFDQTAVLYAVRDGVDRWWTLSEPGRVIADDDGGNRWVADSDGTHRYLKLASDPDTLAEVITASMLGMNDLETPATSSATSQ